MSARYRNIANELRKRITTGQYEPGGRLPTYAALAREFGVGRGAISAAIALLQQEGLVHVSGGRGGTTVRPQGARRIRRGSTVRRGESGYLMPAAHPGDVWTVHGAPTVETRPIPERPAELLGVDQGTPVVRRRRITSPAGDPPYQIADTWIHPDAVADAPQVAEAHTGPGGYLDRLEEAGHGPISWREHIRARHPEADEAAALGIPTAMPVLEIARVGTSARTGAPVEVTLCVIPADRVELVQELRRAPGARWPRAEQENR